MANIFISYSKADKEEAEILASALEKKGYSVWWDRHIDSGAEFSAEIERELNAANAVIVCWSVEGVKSPWVKDEATIAAREGKLKTVSLDGVEPPIGYMQYHCIDFSSWHGDPAAPAFQNLIRSVARQVGIAAPPEKEASFPKSLFTKKITRYAPPAVIVALFLAGSVWFLTRSSHDGSEINTDIASKMANASIAVLPFTDLSIEGDQQYLADGIAEEILNLLAQVPELKVSGRTSSFSFRESRDDLRAIGASLGVDTILEGSVQRNGDKIKITAQLISVHDGFHLWSDTYEQSFADVFTVQEAIARNIVQALKIRLNKLENGRLAPVGTKEMSAYIEFLRGRNLFETRADNQSSYRQALEHFELAVLRDPEYADAYTGIGMVRVVAGHALLDTSYDYNIRMASEALTEAFEIDPDNPQAIAAMSWLRCWQRLWNECLVYASRASDNAPTDPFAHYTIWRASMLTGDMDTARSALRRAMTIDPLNSTYQIQWTNMLVISESIEEGLDNLRALPGRDEAEPLVYGLTSALRARNDKLAKRYFEQIVDISAKYPELNAPLPIYDAAIKAVEGNKQPLKELIFALWKSGDGKQVILPERSFNAAELYELAGEYETAAHIMSQLYESGDIIGPMQFGSLEWRLSRGQAFSQEFLRHHAYHEFWSLPGMAELEILRRKNNAPWGLPLPEEPKEE